MDGWIVAFILYLIPVLCGLVKNETPHTRDTEIWEALLWPPLMLIGIVILWFQSRKR